MSVVIMEGIRDISRSGQGATSRSRAGEPQISLRDMTDDLFARIQARLDALKISARKASIDSGLGPDAIRDIGRKPNNSVTLSTIEKLAIGLRTTPEWLAFDIDNRPPAEPAHDGGLRVEGEVRAGTWLEVDLETQGRERNLDLYPSVPVNLDTRWPADSQFGLIVRGPSINRHAVDGDILACVDCWAINRPIGDGELVIVERIKDGGHYLERTAKFYEDCKDHYKLWPDSTDPRYQEAIVVPKGEPGEEVDDTGTTIRIRAIVSWVHRKAVKRPNRSADGHHS